MQIKPHISRLPTLPYTVPAAKTDKRLAVSIPLFHSQFQWIENGIETQRFQNVHCRGAIWVALSLLWNTDLGRNGVEVFFHIEDTVWDTAMPVFEAFGVDAKWLRPVTIPGESDPNIGDVHYGKIYIGVLDAQMDADIFMIVDSDAFVCTAGAPLEWYQSLTAAMFRKTPSAFEFRPHTFDYRFWTEKCCHAAGLQYAPEQPAYAQEKNAYQTLGIPYPASSEKNDASTETVVRPLLENAYKTIPARHNLRKIIERNVSRCYQSKFILGMYGVAHPMLNMRDILDIQMFVHRQHYELSQDKQYIHHVIFGADRCDSFFNRFYRDLTRNIPIEQPHFDAWREIYGSGNL